MLIKVFSVEIYVYFAIMHLNMNSHSNKYLYSQRKSYNKETRMHIPHNYVWISHVVNEDKTTPNNGLSFAAYSLATNANYDICKTFELMHVIILAGELCMYRHRCICMYGLQSFTCACVSACTGYSHLHLQVYLYAQVTVTTFLRKMLWGQDIFVNSPKLASSRIH